MSASLISVRFSHKWHSSTNKLAIDLAMTQAIHFVVRRAKSVTLRSSLKYWVGSRLIHGAEEFGLKDLENGHSVECRSRLASRGVDTSSES